MEDKLKFCVFIPCHNEEDVIVSTIENFAKIDYSDNLYDVFIIADNCNDNTAFNANNVIERLNIKNIKVLQRFEKDPKKKGKPHALRWGISVLEEKDSFYNKYDMFMILDADNFVDTNILKEFNSQYLSCPENKKPVLMQSYLDSKNSNNFISRGYSNGYRITNRFYVHAKTFLGTNTIIGGTGFVMSINFLKEIGGYNAKSLTEDLEIQTIAALHGKTTLYNHNVRIYDEKPTGLKQSFIQKTRWAQGHWWMYFNYYFKMFISIFKSKSIKEAINKADTMMYLGVFTNFVAMILIIIIYAIAYLFNYNIAINFPYFSQISIIFTIYHLFIAFPFAIFADGHKGEKKKFLVSYIYNLLALFVSSYMFVFAGIKGLFKYKNQSVWAKTKHNITSLSIKEDKVN